VLERGELFPGSTNHCARADDFQIRMSRLVVLEVIGRQVPTVSLEGRDKVRKILLVGPVDVREKRLTVRNPPSREGSVDETVEVSGRIRNLRLKVVPTLLNSELGGDPFHKGNLRKGEYHLARAVL